MSSKNFNMLGLDDRVLKSINELGFEEPSQIQEQSIPIILDGFDIIGQAQTGTGKTLAYAAPLISKIIHTGKIEVLVLTPTRELSVQVNDEIRRLSKYSMIKSVPIYGGQPIDRQIKALRMGMDIVVGTPGRILDHIKRKTLNLSSVKYFVLDEADEMLNMGFIDEIEEVISSIPSDRQTLLFSATMPSPIRKLALKHMKSNTKNVSIVKSTMTVPKTKQFYFEIKHNERFESLCRILDVDEPESAIIFCRTKKGVDELVENMVSRGYIAEGMHGDINQNQRQATLKKFRDKNIDFLVATDVAARGIDVEDVSHVINYDLPEDTESYVHRIGRTGRANKEGIAYSLVTPREYMTLKQIEKHTKSKIRRKEIPSVDDVFISKYKNILKEIKHTLDNEDYTKFIPFATELDEEYNLVDVAAALIKIVLQKQVKPVVKLSNTSTRKVRHTKSRKPRR